MTGLVRFQHEIGDAAAKLLETLGEWRRAGARIGKASSGNKTPVGLRLSRRTVVDFRIVELDSNFLEKPFTLNRPANKVAPCSTTDMT
jgi:hypothetical protein